MSHAIPIPRVGLQSSKPGANDFWIADFDRPWRKARCTEPKLPGIPCSGALAPSSPQLGETPSPPTQPCLTAKSRTALLLLNLILCYLLRPSRQGQPTPQLTRLPSLGSYRDSIILKISCRTRGPMVHRPSETSPHRFLAMVDTNKHQCNSRQTMRPIGPSSTSNRP